MMEACNCCGREEDNLLKFYYGFFDGDYNPEHWCKICKGCQKKFLNARLSSMRHRELLVEMQNDITERLALAKEAEEKRELLTKLVNILSTKKELDEFDRYYEDSFISAEDCLWESEMTIKVANN